MDDSVRLKAMELRNEMLNKVIELDFFIYGELLESLVSTQKTFEKEKEELICKGKNENV